MSRRKALEEEKKPKNWDFKTKSGVKIPADLVARYKNASKNEKKKLQNHFKMYFGEKFAIVQPPRPMVPIVEVVCDDKIIMSACLGMDVVPFGVKEVSCLVSLQTVRDKMRDQQETRLSLDLVCAIDVSSSMEGQSLELVKTTLSQLCKQLEPTDKIALIVFNAFEQTLCELTECNNKGKKLFIQRVNEMQAFGSTNIEAGVSAAINALQNSTNEFASIMLLTDGKDNDTLSIIQRLDQLIEASTFPEKFSFPTFGFGQEHDAHCMNHLSERFNSKYYYIEDHNSIQSAFQEYLRSLVTVHLCKIKVRVKKVPCDVDVEVTNLYTEGYQEEFEISPMALEDQKQIALELKINPEAPMTREIKPLNIEVNYISAKTGERMQNSQDIVLALSAEALPNQVRNPNIEIPFLTQKSARSIKGILHCAEQNDMPQAHSQTQDLLEELSRNPLGSSPEISKVLEILQKAKEYMANSSEFEKGGSALLYSLYQDCMNPSYDENNMILPREHLP